MKPRFLSFLPAILSIALAPLGHATTTIAADGEIGSGNTVPSGSKSLAVGSANQVASSSLAVGHSNIAKGLYSISFGETNSTDDTNAYTLVVGENSNLVASESTLLLGYYNNAANEFGSLIAGSNNLIDTSGSLDGLGNIVLGESNQMHKTTSDPSGFAIHGSALIGTGNETSQPMAIAIGQSNIAQTGTVTVGHYNATVSSAAFVVGNGTSTSARANALVVLNNGNVVIPNGTLTIGAESAVTPSYLTTNKYLKPAYGTGASVSGGGLFAFGNSAVADNLDSWAIGSNASSTGPNSIAIGGDSSSWGYYATAFGYNAMAGGSFAQGFGTTALAFGDYSTALGTEAYTGGDRATAITGGSAEGDQSFAAVYAAATGDYSIAFTGASASGDYSIAIGGKIPGDFANVASGDHATAIGGYRATASGPCSFTSGYRTKSTASHSVVLGSLNLSASGTALVPSTPANWIDNEVLFELGNGEPDYSPAQYSNAITTLKNGQTTVTNKFWSSSTPEVVPTTTGSSDGKALVVEGHAEVKGNTVLDGKVIMTTAQGDISMGIYE